MTGFRGIQLDDLLKSFDGGELAGNGGVTSLSSFYAPFRREIADLAASYLPKNARILSVGCGTGEMEQALREAGYRVAALDLRPTVADLVRARGIPFFRADAHLLPIRDESVDAVLFSESIGQIDPEKGLREAARVLPRGGVLLLTTYPVPRVGDLQGELVRYCYSGSVDWQTTPEIDSFAQEYLRLGRYHLYPPELLKLFLQHAGFSVLRLYEPYYEPPEVGQAGMIVVAASRVR